MNVNTVYSLINYITNKVQSGYISPDEFNLIINQSQFSYLSTFIRQFQQYQHGRPIPKYQFGNNEITRQSITPFITNITLTIDGQGIVAYPNDYIVTDTILTIGDGVVKYVQQNQLSAFLKSKIDKIEDNPIYVIENNRFKFYPNNIGSVKLSYIKKPNDIIWGYTINVDGIPVYDINTSEDPEWDDLDMLEIISRALRMVGVNLQSNAVSQYANEITKTGQ
jgi:hypothetical protein